MTRTHVAILRVALRNRVAEQFAFAEFVRDSERSDAETLADALWVAAARHLQRMEERLDALGAVLDAREERAT